jgi:nitroreductase
MGRHEGGLLQAEFSAWKALAVAGQVGSEPNRAMNQITANETIALLKRRRSLSPPNMAGPGPSAAEIETMLTIASRVPDHGKLAPWRFVLFEGGARDRAGAIALELKLADKPDLDEAGRTIERMRFSHAPLVVAVVSRAAPHVKIPEWEQVLSAGAACMNLVIAANALGFAAGWITEWCAYDPRFRTAIGLAEHERIAGFVHIGRPKIVMEDRARPALADIVTVFAP